MGYQHKQSNERSFGRGNPAKWLWSGSQQRLLVVYGCIETTTVVKLSLLRTPASLA